MTEFELNQAKHNAEEIRDCRQIIPYNSIGDMIEAIEQIRDQNDKALYFPMYCRVGSQAFLFNN